MLLFSVKVISQNATINYSSTSNNNLSNISNCPTCCNVFNQSGNNPAVGGYAHWPISGGAIYNGTSIEMQTRKSIQPLVDNGTAYGIAYPFKTGYNYVISIDLGYSANPTTAFPKITLSTRQTLPNANDSDPISCGPVSRSKFVYSIGTIIKEILPDVSTKKTYATDPFSVNSQQNYLALTVSDGGANITTALIFKVSITESAPSPSFSLASSISSIQCGATTPVNFTVTNSGSSTTVSGFSWNLGSASNGWLYDGSVAPATITTGSHC